MGKPIPVIVPKIGEQKITLEKMKGIHIAARRARILQSDLPTGTHESDYFSLSSEALAPTHSHDDLI